MLDKNSPWNLVVKYEISYKLANNYCMILMLHKRKSYKCKNLKISLTVYFSRFYKWHIVGTPETIYKWFNNWCPVKMLHQTMEYKNTRKFRGSDIECKFKILQKSCIYFWNHLQLITTFLCLYLNNQTIK